MIAKFAKMSFSNSLFLQSWVYAGTARPRPKLVVLVLDVGRDTAESQLRVGRGAAEAVLSTLGHRDYVRKADGIQDSRGC